MNDSAPRFHSHAGYGARYYPDYPMLYHHDRDTTIRSGLTSPALIEAKKLLVFIHRLRFMIDPG